MRIAFVPALLLPAATAAAPAVAKPALLRATLVGTGTRVIGSDGARFAAWQGSDVAETLVYDAATRRTMRVAPPAGCAVTAIGAGALLATCDSYPLLSSAQVMNLRTGVWRQVVPPASDTSGFTPDRSFVGIGAQWIQARMQDHHSSWSIFHKRSDGTSYAGASPFGAHVQPDLDAAGLRRAICPPITATPEDLPVPESSDGWLPVQLEGRYVLEVLGDPPHVVLGRCGRSRRQTVCRTWCFTPTLSHGRVLWADDVGRLHVRNLRSRRARTFVVPNHPVGAVHPLGAHLVLVTDQIAGTQRIVVRIAAARTLRRP